MEEFLVEWIFLNDVKVLLGCSSTNTVTKFVKYNGIKVTKPIGGGRIRYNFYDIQKAFRSNCIIT